jgi:hypothetical protein
VQLQVLGMRGAASLSSLVGAWARRSRVAACAQNNFEESRYLAARLFAADRSGPSEEGGADEEGEEFAEPGMRYHQTSNSILKTNISF